MGFAAGNAAVLGVIFEDKVLATGGAVYPADQVIILDDIEQDVRCFPIININQNGIFCQNTGKFRQRLNLFKVLEISAVFEFFNALFVFCFNVSFEKHTIHLYPNSAMRFLASSM